MTHSISPSDGMEVIFDTKEDNKEYRILLRHFDIIREIARQIESMNGIHEKKRAVREEVRKDEAVYNSILQNNQRKVYVGLIIRNSF